MKQGVTKLILHFNGSMIFSGCDASSVQQPHSNNKISVGVSCKEHLWAVIINQQYIESKFFVLKEEAATLVLQNARVLALSTARFEY